MWRWALTIFLVSVPGLAAAQGRPITVALAQELPAACPGEGLASEVESRLGRVVFVPASEAEFLVRVETVTDPPGQQLRVVVERNGAALGERVVDVASCEERLDRAALIVALIVDTQLPTIPPEAPTDPAPADPAPTDPAPTDPEPVAEPAPEPAAPLPDPADPTPTGEAPSNLEVQVFLEGAGHIGWMPTVGGGGGLGVAVRADARWGLRLSALAWAPSEGGTEGVTVELLGGALRVAGCAGAGVDVAFFEGCAVGEVGVLSVSGGGLDEAVSTVRPTVRGGVEVRVTLAVGAVRLGLALGLDVPLLRDRFVFTQADGSIAVAHEPEALGGILSASIGWVP